MNAKLAQIGFIEGLTYLLLLFIALPLNYWFGICWVLPTLLSIFLVSLAVYLTMLILAFRSNAIPGWAFGFGLVGALLPFGPFVFDQIVLEPMRLNDTTKP